MKMNNSSINKYLKESFGIEDRLLDLLWEKENELRDVFDEIDNRSFLHQARVLKAFQESNVSDMHFGWNTGYGYDDPGREAVERVFAKVFCGEKALVRPNIVNGTHAISLALLGLLKRGDKIIYATGAPYDTLQSVTGYKSSGDKSSSSEDHSGSTNLAADYEENYTGTLRDLGVEYQEIELLPDGRIDLDSLREALDDKVKMVAIQRSKGYSLRNSIIANQIKDVADIVHEYSGHITIMVDNCYCEFIEEDEPLSLGADVICGSLIKNPGGGLALTGGYICGKEALIDQISYRLTCPGIGSECGLTFGQNRSVLEGLFQAPRVTTGALKGAILCAAIFDSLGFEVYPNYSNDPDLLSNRCDIIQAVKLNTPEKLEAFCQGIQSAAPIDSHVTPVPAPMPGYDDEVIMAAGAFVQGSSIELSADGPLREPYVAYFQGGLTYEHSKIGVLKAAQSVINHGL